MKPCIVHGDRAAPIMTVYNFCFQANRISIIVTTLYSSRKISQLTEHFCCCRWMPYIVGGMDGMGAIYRWRCTDTAIILSLRELLQHYTNGGERFLCTSCGQPGNCHDSTVLQSTDMWENMHNICYLKTDGMNRVTAPALVLGDGAVSFRTFFMKRYPDGHPTDAQRKFNKEHSHSRTNVEHI